jgi:thymidylate kinase
MERCILSSDTAATTFCFEGPNGVGKGTLIALIADRLKREGLLTQIVKTAEYEHMIAVRSLIRTAALRDSEEIIRCTAQARLQDFWQHTRRLWASHNALLFDRDHYTSAILQAKTLDEIRVILDLYEQLGYPRHCKVLILDAPVSVLRDRIVKRGRLNQQVQTETYLSEKRNQYRYLSQLINAVVIDTTGALGETTETVYREVIRSFG